MIYTGKEEQIMAMLDAFAVVFTCPYNKVSPMYAIGKENILVVFRKIRHTKFSYETLTETQAKELLS